jgi:PAP2 superfamily C-terminal
MQFEGPENTTCKTSVVDIGHQLIPQMHVPVLAAIAFSGLWIPFVLLSSARMAIVRRIAVRFMLLFALRAITNVVTILPKEETCNSKVQWHMAFNGGCYDKVFSGHSATAVLVSLALVSFGVWPAWAGWAYTIGMVLMLLVSRGHYTVDIVLGLALGYLGWTAPMPFNT